MLSVASGIAIGAIVLALAAGWSRRFLAAGALIMANVVVHILTVFGPSVPRANGFISIIHGELALDGQALAAAEPFAFVQLITSMFVHADFFHLLGNLIILLAFALPFEERIGHRRFLIAYLGAGLLGSLAQVASNWGQPMLLMGASGAVFGIIGAFAASYPRLVVPLPLPLLFIIIFVRMRVMVAAVVFGSMQLLYLAFLSPFDNTAYFAHIGGLVAGLAFGFALKRTLPEATGQGKPRPRFDVRDLEPFVHDASARRAYEHLATSQDEPEIFVAWLEVFWRHAKCPDTLQTPVRFSPGTVHCADHEHRLGDG